MSRPSKFDTMTVEQLEQLLEQRRNQEHETKKKELLEARAKVKELEAYFAGKKTRKGKSVLIPKAKRTRGKKRGGLKNAILALLQHGPQPIKGIVVATKGKYGSVFQTLNNLRKKKLVIKDSKRGGAYSIVK